MISAKTRYVLGTFVTRAPRAAICTTLAMTMPASWAEPEPVCRWLQLDETRVYQCAVLSDVASSKKVELVDGLPDPTLPLAEQGLPARQAKPDLIASWSDPVSTESAEMNSGAEQRSSSSFIETVAERFMVLGVGTIEALTTRLEAERDSDYSLLRSRNRLSLGVFSTADNARVRQSALAKMGIESEVEAMAGNAKSRSNKVSQEAIARQGTLERDDDVIQAETEASHSERWQRPGYTQLPIAHSPDDDYLQSMLVKVNGEITSANDMSGASSLGPNGMSNMVVKATNVEAATQEPTPNAKKITGYIVASVGDVDGVIAKLEAINANDYVLLRRGPYKDRVSVGVYASMENAFARQSYFAQQGIASEVISRSDEKVVEKNAKPKPDYPQIALIPLDI